MFAGPPKIIESLVALLTPPASREHVLGDLRERYAGTRSYLADAFSAVPGAIAGHVLRIAHWQLLAMEACALYLSFLTAAWAAFGAAFVWRHAGFVGLVALPALAFAGLVAAEVYGGRKRFVPAMAALWGAAFAIDLGTARGNFPAWMLVTGGAVESALAVRLLSSMRMCGRSGDRPPGRAR